MGFSAKPSADSGRWVCDVEVEVGCVSPSGRKPIAHGVSHGKKARSASPARGERPNLVSQVELQGVVFRPCRGWRFGARYPSLARWATIWRPCGAYCPHSGGSSVQVRTVLFDWRALRQYPHFCVAHPRQAAKFPGRDRMVTVRSLTAGR